ncbi:MAG: hypothetical protein FWG10_06660 [Eubacteriaceae bacterium]|nr:hypothetical protein [Eubacteriaceae bacterium]
MGEDLVNKIIGQTSIKLQSWSRKCISVFLFSSQTGNALDTFCSCVQELFGPGSHVYITYSNADGLEGILKQIQEKIDRHEAPRAAKITVRDVLSASESSNLDVPANCAKQTIRLVDSNSQILSDDDIYVYKTKPGLESLLVYSYIQDTSVAYISKAGGVLVESIVSSYSRDSWVHTLYSSLEVCLRVAATSKEGLDLLAASAESGLEDSKNYFLSSLEPFPSLESFPIDENNYEKLFGENRGFGSKLAGLFKKVPEKKSFDLEQALYGLFGIGISGDTVIREYRKSHFEGQDLERLFGLAWSPPNPWYHKVPLQWLMDNFAALITKKIFIAKQELSALEEKAQQKKADRFLQVDFSTLCREISNEFGFPVIYGKTAELWYWEQCLFSVQYGDFLAQSKAAKARIEIQLNALDNYWDIGNNVASGGGMPPIDWSVDLADSIELFKPYPAPWSVETLNTFIKRNCDSIYYRSTEVGATACCAIACEDEATAAQVGKMELFNGTMAVQWGFSSDIPIDGFLMALLAPRKYLGLV